MTVNVTKQLWSLARLLLPGVGFALVCFGVYLVSKQVNIPAYIIIVMGFMAVITGVFWTMCHNMRTKMYQRGGHQNHIQVFTVDRPSSFPPSYEESQRNQVSSHTVPETVVVVDAVDVVLSLAPPLYNQDGSEAPDCTWSWEQPPRYSQVERCQQGQVGAEERREALSIH
ncbi:transmembrane protein 252-like [Solea solea]|uniref:transmembrane protein 252-like n=1 Tax=Solea solea TaxID=90069 RepID=UPI00272CC09C|nr:transmembrane protein 252-like [Solea solea]